MAVTHKPSIDEALTSLVRGTQCDPFAILGPHPDEGGTIVRAFRPAARSIDVRLVASNTLVPMERRGTGGIFEARVPGRAERDGTDGFSAPDYRLRITYAGGEVFEID